MRRGGFKQMATTTMTKTQLTALLAQRMGDPITKRKAGDFLEELAAIAMKETKKNGVFVLPGIGRLVKVQRKARMGRNPQTGQPLQIKAKTAVKFRVAKSVKDAISPISKAA
jgi:DNA-binding protein HU-beta